jgi:hypothetical protein
MPPVDPGAIAMPPSSEIELSGWSAGFDSTRCTQLLQSAAGLDAATARHVVERLLRGERQTLTIRSDGDARLIVAALGKLGAIARCTDPSSAASR